jgi:DNA primase catalytic subunit
MNAIYETELRDTFAGKAMEALIFDCDMNDLDRECYSDDEVNEKQAQIARISYEMADAMLKARLK